MKIDIIIKKYKNRGITVAELNQLQKEFMKMLAEIQYICVQTALCQKKDCLQDILYDVTADVIIRILENIDGYGSIPKLDVISNDTGQTLKNPYIELHDVVCDYIKGV